MIDLYKTRIRSHSVAGLSSHLLVDPRRETWGSLEFVDTLDRLRGKGKHPPNRQRVNHSLLSFATDIWVILKLQCQGPVGYPKDSVSLESSIPIRANGNKKVSLDTSDENDKKITYIIIDNRLSHMSWIACRHERLAVYNSRSHPATTIASNSRFVLWQLAQFPQRRSVFTAFWFSRAIGESILALQPVPETASARVLAG